MGGKRTVTPPADAGTTTPAAAPAQSPTPAPTPAPAASPEPAPASEPATALTPSEPANAESPETVDLDAGAEEAFVEVRVLLAFDGHEPNDVVEVAEGAVIALEDSGHVDSHPHAVAYARSLLA